MRKRVSKREAIREYTNPGNLQEFPIYDDGGTYETMEEIRAHQSMLEDLEDIAEEYGEAAAEAAASDWMACAINREI